MQLLTSPKDAPLLQVCNYRKFTSACSIHNHLKSLFLSLFHYFHWSPWLLLVYVVILAWVKILPLSPVSKYLERVLLEYQDIQSAPLASLIVIVDCETGVIYLYVYIIGSEHTFSFVSVPLLYPSFEYMCVLACKVSYVLYMYCTCLYVVGLKCIVCMCVCVCLNSLYCNNLPALITWLWCVY